MSLADHRQPSGGVAGVSLFTLDEATALMWKSQALVTEWLHEASQDTSTGASVPPSHIIKWCSQGGPCEPRDPCLY